MATLASDIIRDAYRESNLIAIGTEPTGAQTDEGLRLLARILSSVYGTKEGEELTDMPIGRNNIVRPSGFPYYGVTPDVTDFFVPPNTRLVLNLDAPLTVYLNPMPADGERFAILDASDNLGVNALTIEANGRTILGSDSLVLTTSGTAVEYIYRADLGNWLLISPLSSADVWPFPAKFDDMFVIMLAMRLNPRNDVPIDPQSITALRDVTMLFKAKYRQQQWVNSELGLLKTSSDRSRYENYDGTSEFNSGYPGLFWNFRW